MNTTKDISELNPIHQKQFNIVFHVLGNTGFEAWFEHVKQYKNTPENEVPYVDAQRFKKKTVDIKKAAQDAREAVSGYAANNGARKAVEALADAIEGNA